MLSFLNFLNESADKRGSLHAFDVDGTHFNTTAQVHVVDSEGNRVKSLSHHEFNTHKLPPGHSYDFGEFRSSDQFSKEKPIKPMLAKLKAVHSNSKKNPNSKVIIATARSNFDNKEGFLDKFKNYGVDINNIRVERAGNVPGMLPTAEKKAITIKKHLDTNNYKEAHLYDDDTRNLDRFLDLKHEYPNTNFHAHQVMPNGSTSKYIKTENNEKSR